MGLFIVVSVLFYTMPKIDIRNITIWLIKNNADIIQTRICSMVILQRHGFVPMMGYSKLFLSHFLSPFLSDCHDRFICCF
ncbi:hypothetical protein [Moraxella lacunata]|uniref:hypothetical protein n=1 Tax=Moraxella lacunata TaxID=477 RepID=UPI003EDEAFE0